VGTRSDLEVHDLRTVEIAYVLLRSTVIAALPLAVMFIAQRHFGASPFGPLRVVAISLYSLLVVGVFVHAVVSLRRFERHVREPGSSGSF
jgi:peptidoglycan biosynthesis protein MviN/MurJ (putative lipid II flippase)